MLIVRLKNFIFKTFFKGMFNLINQQIQVIDDFRKEIGNLKLELDDSRKELNKSNAVFNIMRTVNVSTLASILHRIPYFKDKIDLFNCFNYRDGFFYLNVLSESDNNLSDLFGKNSIIISELNCSPIEETKCEFENIHYAC